MSVKPGIWEALVRNRLRSRVVLGLVTVPALLATLSLQLDPRWTNALPREDPLIDEFLAVVEDPLRGSTVFAVVDGPGARPAARDFAEAVASLPHVRFVHGVGQEPTPFEMMFLNPDALDELGDVSDRLDVGELILAGVSEETGDVAELGLDPTGETARTFVLETLEALAVALEGGNPAATDDLVAPLFEPPPGVVSELDGSILVRVETDFSENSIEDLSEFAAAMDGLADSILMRPPHPRIRYTGYPVTAHAEVEAIETSGKRLTLWALLIIVVLMKLILGDLRSILNSIVVLMTALVWVLGLTRMVFGEMNTVTMIMGMVLIGLGIDFCIHWQNHLRLGRAAGLRGTQLAGHVFDTSSPPILAGACTTAGAFLCVLLMDVPSLQEFALLSAGGVLLTAVTVLFVMPVVVREDAAETATRNRVREWVASLARASMARSRRTAGAFLVLVILGGWSLRGLGYDFNYSRLQIGGLPSYHLKQEIIQRFDLSSDILVQRVEGVEASAEAADRLAASPEIARVESISDYLLTGERRRARVEAVERLRERFEGRPAHRYDMDELTAIHDELVARRRARDGIPPSGRAGEDAERYSRALRRIVRAVEPGTVDVLNAFNADLRRAFTDQIVSRADTSAIAFTDLPEQLRAGFETSDPGIYMQYIYPAHNLWEQGPAEAMEPFLIEAAPGAVGLSRISYRLMDLMFSQGTRMAVLALVVVLIALRVALRRWSLALMAAVPLVMGGFLTAGTLPLVGIRVNFYNLVGVPILLGIGIDDGVHMINAYRRQERPDPVAAVRQTGPAILLTSLTSMVGFGCLSFYRHPGMATLGAFLFIGVGWCLVTTLTLLPVLLKRAATSER